MANKKKQITSEVLKHTHDEIPSPNNKVQLQEYSSMAEAKHGKEPTASFFTDAQLGRALLLVDKSGKIKYCSPAAARGLGASSQALIGQAVTNVLPELKFRPSAPGEMASSLPPFRDGQWRVSAGQDGQGRKLYLEVTLMSLEMEGYPLYLLELREPQIHADEDEKLRHIQEAAELSGDAVAITDAQGLILYVNPAFEILTGYGKDEILGRTHAVMKAGVHKEKLYAQMWAVLQANATFRAQFVNRHKNGTLFYEDKIIRPYRNACGKTTHFIGSGRDVTDRVQIMRRLEHFANYDGLTGLANRNLFMDRLQHAQAHALRYGEGFVLMLLDIDQFKTINDTCGHAVGDAVGDAVLQTAASRLKQCLREEDTVARLGGDEFSLILGKTALRQDVKNILEKMRALLHEPFIVDGHNFSIQASIGVAFYPQQGEDAHTLLKHADRAMYRVKAAGGNSYHFFGESEASPPAYPKDPFAGIPTRFI